jgi:hypothetical protein
VTSRKLTSAAAAVSLAGAAVLGLAAATPALAQEANSPYVNTGDVPRITDSTPVPGQRVTVDSGDGAFPQGTVVTVTVSGTNISGTETAGADGSVEFTFQSPNQPGRYDVVFAAGGQTVTVPFTVVAAAAGGPGRGQGTGGNSALPFTGTDAIVPLTITGVTLVGIGGGIVVAARRRREDMPGGVA